MPDPTISVPYHQGLKPLEELLKRVKRPGDFYVRGQLETPMPTVTVDGVGVLSFPLLESQIQALIAGASRAPYGRGEETLLDTGVRKVWQLPAEKVALGGKSWSKTLTSILAQVKAGLGCQELEVRAEMYKLLVYDRGGFFLAHRDTEKVAGMFGTLVVVLPSFHTGGELVLRHGCREVTVYLSQTEVSELGFAAFYSDCEHEVRPITEGNRVCLVYNLIQERPKKGRTAPLAAPSYARETSQAADGIHQALTGTDAPAKLVWLLEHQYTAASLCFAGLKNADAARAKVLVDAARQSGCELHLAMVHIEESGSAESDGGSYGGYGRHRHRRLSAGSESFTVIEVCDSSQYVDGWVSLNEERVELGKVPLEENELLPEGSLDDEKPDEQRYMEATGNEGASFERAYHRGAIVLWRPERIGHIRLQAGLATAYPHLQYLVREANAKSVANAREEALAFAARMITRWEAHKPDFLRHRKSERPGRGSMLATLIELGDADLIERFLSNVLARDFDGSETESLVKAVRLLGPEKTRLRLTELVERKMPGEPRECVKLLSALLKAKPCLTSDPSWLASLRDVTAAAVSGLKKIGDPTDRDPWRPRWPAREPQGVDGQLVAGLLTAIDRLGAADLMDAAVDALGSRPKVFDANTVLVSALTLLREAADKNSAPMGAWILIWKRTGELLLGRSETAPEEPQDWRQAVKIECNCGDCKELITFARDPLQREHHFRVAESRRQHIQSAIPRNQLDMSFTTQRSGSPYTLVCVKTRTKHAERCQQYKQDIDSLTALAKLIDSPAAQLAPWMDRIAAATRNR